MHDLDSSPVTDANGGAPMAEQAEAGGRVVDSLINYETVKYFGNERHEVSRRHDSCRGPVRAGGRRRVSLHENEGTPPEHFVPYTTQAAEVNAEESCRIAKHWSCETAGSGHHHQCNK